MSGQPVKTKADQAKYLDEYMENLSLEIALQNQNEEANRIYRQTGQLPAVSSLPDTRTVEQKLSDVETLKKGIIDDVSNSIDKSLAVVLVNSIIESRYNSDNVLLRFFAQRAPEFMKEIEKRYKYGLRDINDIYATVKYIERAYAETQESLTSIKDVFGRVQTPIQINQDILFKLKEALMNLTTKISFSDLQEYGIDINKLKEIIQILTIASTALPTQTTMKDWSEVINFALAQQDSEPFELYRPLLMDIIKKIKVINDTIQSLPDVSLLKTIETNITKALGVVGNPQEQLNIIRDSISNLMKSFFKGQETFQNIKLILSAIQTDKQDINNDIQQLIPFIGYRSPQSSQRGAFEQYQTNIALQPTMGLPERTAPGIPYTNADRDVLLSIAYGYLFNQYNAQVQNPPLPLPQVFQNTMNLQQKRQTFNNVLDQLEAQVQGFTKDGFKNMDPELYRIIQGGTIRSKSGGSIRTVKAPVKSFISRIDTTAGIKASPDFVPFGTYLINRRKISDGIVCLKTSKGSHIQGFPNKRVSTNLTNVIKNIIGGSVPSYEDLSTLDAEEKSYLHKIAKKSNILDKLSIPSPNKDEIEKEIHQFEVMKGEIISGNDNKDLIKKFKLLLLKLKMKGMIPKSQAEEILTDLSSLGY